MVYEEHAYQQMADEESEIIEVPAVKSKDIHPINKLLSKHINSKKSLIQILAFDNGMTIDKKFKIITDNTGRQHTPAVLLHCYGLSSHGVERCPVCSKGIEADDLIYHLTDTWKNGHSLTTKQTIKLFSMEFWLWEYHANIGFKFLGSPIEFKRG